MKAEKLKEVEQVVTALNRKLKIDATNENSSKLEKQIRKIARHIIDDVHTIIEKKVSKEEKLLAREIKRQKKQNRILAARQILSGKIIIAPQRGKAANRNLSTAQ